jgi:uncharacterized protein (DUF486 family)
MVALLTMSQQALAQTYPLAITTTGSGGGTVTSDVGGIACGSACGTTLASGTIVTLTATPASASSFIGWSGGGCSGTESCAVILNQARNVSAMFGGSGAAAFGTADLAGTWRLFAFLDDRSGNSPRWSVLTVTLDETGAFVSGTYDTLNGTEQTGTLTGATVTLDPASGLVSGALWGDFGEVTVPYAQMDLAKVVLTTVASQGAERRGMTIGLKGGGGFTAADLKGTWHLSQFSDTVGTTGNDPQWTHITVTLDETGTVVTGTSVLSDGTTATVTGGSLTLDGSGFVSGTLLVAEDTITYPLGRLDPYKRVIALVASGPSANRRTVSIGLNAGGQVTTADLEGTWALAQYEDASGPDGNAPAWTAVTLTVAADGTVTSGSTIPSDGAPSVLSGGTLSVDTEGAVTGSLANGPSVSHGRLDPSKTLLSLVFTQASGSRGILIGGKSATENTKAALLTPTPGSTLETSATFIWSAGVGAAEYWLTVGTGVGGQDVYSASQGQALTASLPTLPAGGGTLYVRLYTRFLTTGWQSTDYTFTAMAGAKAALTSPTPGSTLGTTATFTWSAGVGAAEYWLTVGTGVGGQDVYSASQGQNLTGTVPMLPAGGGPLYVRLYTRFLTTGW